MPRWKSKGLILFCLVLTIRVSSAQRQNSQRKFNISPKNRRNDKVKSEFDEKTDLVKQDSMLPESPKLRLFVKDWVAQWDPLYNAWFYYHPATDYSTWDKPGELAHMTLDTPGAAETRNPVSHHNVIRHPSGADKPRRPPRARSQYRQTNTFQPHYNQQAEDKFLEDENGNFFGFNYNSTVKEEYGLGKSIIGSINYMYDNIIESYVEDIYTGVIEDYTIATVKLIGWFVFGSVLIVKGAVLNHFLGGEVKRSFADVDSGFFSSFPLFKDFERSFPAEESLYACYKGRESCIKNDLREEVDLLASNFYTMKEIYLRWLELGERVGHMAVEGELSL